MRPAVKKVIYIAITVSLLIGALAWMVQMASGEIRVAEMETKTVEDAAAAEDYLTRIGTSPVIQEFSFAPSQKQSEAQGEGDTFRSSPNQTRTSSPTSSLASSRNVSPSDGSSCNSPTGSVGEGEAHYWFKPAKFVLKKKFSFVTDKGKEAIGPIRHVIYLFYRMATSLQPPKDDSLLQIFRQMNENDTPIVISPRTKLHLASDAQTVQKMLGDSVSFLQIKNPFPIKIQHHLELLNTNINGRILIISSKPGLLINNNLSFSLDGRKFVLKGFVREHLAAFQMKYSAFVLSRDRERWYKLESDCVETVFYFSNKHEELKAHLFVFMEQDKLSWTEEDSSLIKRIFSIMLKENYNSNMLEEALQQDSLMPFDFNQSQPDLFLGLCRAFKGLNIESSFIKIGIANDEVDTMNARVISHPQNGPVANLNLSERLSGLQDFFLKSPAELQNSLKNVIIIAVDHELANISTLVAENAYFLLPSNGKTYQLSIFTGFKEVDGLQRRMTFTLEDGANWTEIGDGTSNAHDQNSVKEMYAQILIYRQVKVSQK